MAHGSVRALPPDSLRERTRLTLQYLRYLPRTFALVRESSRAFAVGLIALLLGQAALPAAMAWVGKLIVDAVVAAARTGDSAQRWHVLRLVTLEAGLMAVSTAMSRGQALLRDLMRASLGNHVNTLILEKAATLELRHFEDADFYDKMQNARREASIRPLSMALETASLLQQLLILASYAVLLARLSPWSVLLIVAASVPSFIAEARFSGESFRLNTWRAPEGRRQNYLEWILTRDSHVKEVKLFDLAPLVLRRYRALFEKFYAEDRSLALRKGRPRRLLRRNPQCPPRRHLRRRVLRPQQRRRLRRPLRGVGRAGRSPPAQRPAGRIKPGAPKCYSISLPRPRQIVASRNGHRNPRKKGRARPPWSCARRTRSGRRQSNPDGRSKYIQKCRAAAPWAGTACANACRPRRTR